MYPHVANCACAKVPTAAPFEWRVNRIVGPMRSRAEPEVPIQCVGNGWGFLGAINALRPPTCWPIGPHVKFFYLSDRSGAYDFHRATAAFHCMSLLSHLGHYPCLLGFLLHAANFVDRMSERFFAIDVKAALHGGNCSARVGMIRRADDDSVQ